VDALENVAAVVVLHREHALDAPAGWCAAAATAVGTPPRPKPRSV
jgi:hypothetical protein